MHYRRTLTTITECHQSECHITHTPYRRYPQEPHHTRFHAPGRYARTAWWKRIGYIERFGKLTRIEAGR